MSTWMRPTLGLLEGCILYWLFQHTQFTTAGMVSAAIVLTFPLFALQVKLPNKNTWVLGLSILFVMAVIYGYTAYHLLMPSEHATNSMTTILLTIQCAVSGFILFIFYCAVIEEEHVVFPYTTLFNESWQVILRISLGKLLVLLTWGLFLLASLLFKLLNIAVIEHIVMSSAFFYIMLPFFFGIAMTILHQYEEILTKLRGILLAFCQFLYPLFVVINISFLLVIPFANKNFADFWVITLFLNIINIVLFNGVFQAGFDKPPYSRWFCKLIYASMIITFIYSLYVLKFPWNDIGKHGGTLDVQLYLALIFFIILTLYNLSYCLAIFFSKKPWLSMVKISNTSLALFVALLYLILAEPWFSLDKRLVSEPLSLYHQHTLS